MRVLDHKLIPDVLTFETITTTDKEVAASIQHVLCDIRIAASDRQWECWNHLWGEWWNESTEKKQESVIWHRLLDLEFCSFWKWWLS